MAVTFVANGGFGGNKTSSTTLALNAATSAAVGDLVVVAIALDPGTTVQSISDTTANVYSLAGAVTNGSGTSGVRSEIWASKATVALSNAVVTITFAAAVVAKAAAAYQFSGADNTADVAAGTGTGTSTTPSATLTPTLADDLLFGIVGREGPDNDAAGTADGDNAGGDTWHTLGSTGTGSGGAAASNIGAGWTNGVAPRVDYKITTSAVAQTYNPTLGTSRLWAEVLVTFKATPTGFDPATAPEYLVLDEA